MTRVTRSPVPPFQAIEECLGHAFDYATFWAIVDANGDEPIDLAMGDYPDDEQWCRAEADRLNREHGHA